MENVGKTIHQSRMKRILYISQKPHHPIIDGGSQAIASFFHGLLQCRDLTLTYAPICTKKHPGDFSAVDHSIQLIPLRIDTSISMKVLRRSVSVPMNVLRYSTSEAMSTLYSRDSIEQFDVVICDGFYALTIVPKSWFASKQIIYRSHNLEHEHWKQRARFMPWYLRWFYKRISRQMKRLEYSLVSATHTVLSISHEETQRLREWNANTHTCYPVFKTKHHLIRGNESVPSIGFIGNFDWFPNVDAMHKFIGEIWPLISAKHPSVQLEIAGRGSEIFNHPTHRIKGLGFVDSLENYYQRQQVMVSPLAYGTGLNMKVFEALSYGKVIVTSALSVRGFENKTPFLIAETPKEFAEFVLRMLGSSDQRGTLESNISTYIKTTFDQETFRIQLEQHIHG